MHIIVEAACVGLLFHSFATKDQILTQWMYDHSEMVRRTAYYYVKVHYFEHLTSSEIAAMLDAKETTIRSRLSRGLAKLKIKWDEGAIRDA